MYITILDIVVAVIRKDVFNITFFWKSLVKSEVKVSEEAQRCLFYLATCNLDF
jgi:hypothetical protein